MLSRSYKEIVETLFRRFKVSSLASTAESLRRWSSSDFWTYIVNCEKRVFNSRFSQLPGFRLMSLGAIGDPESLDCFGQLHRFSFHASDIGTQHAAVCDYSQLPMPTGVVDVVLLQHSLEFSSSPKLVLAEVCRVVMPGGHLVLCVFNPFGFHGGIKFLMQLVSKQPQYRFHNLRKNRLVDWLSLLSFQVLDVTHIAHKPFGFGNSKVQSSFEHWCEALNVPFGNVYIIHAIKREVQGIGWKRTSWTSSPKRYGKASQNINSISHKRVMKSDTSDG